MLGHAKQHLIDRGPTILAGGLALMLVCVTVSSPGVLTAMAVITLGASSALASRQGAVGALFFIHATVYGALYLLFVGAAMDAAPPGQQAATQIDLLASLLILACHAPLVARGAAS